MFLTTEDRDYVYSDMLSEAHKKGKITHFGTHEHILLRHNGKHNYRRVYRKCPSEAVYHPYAHQVIALKFSDTLGLPDNHETSHLCHIKDCIQPNHIVIEHQSINKERNHCLDERKLRNDSTYCSKSHNGPNCIPGN